MRNGDLLGYVSCGDCGEEYPVFNWNDVFCGLCKKQLIKNKNATVRKELHL